MYNALEQLRAGEEFSEKDQRVHEQGLISVLKQINDDLDAAVFEAYGWPATLSDEEILSRLVALNAERAAEEARGLVRWLRPEFQAPASRDAASRERERPEQTTLALPEEQEAGGKKAGGRGSERAGGKEKAAWPKEQAERTKAIQAALASATAPPTAAELAQGFLRARADTVEEILDALVSLGLARRLRGGKYTAS